MKWLDYGQVFNVSDYGIEYSKAPQALVFDDFVRIYFSACKPDAGKLTSYVCYVDYDKDFRKVLDFSDKVIAPGKLGCYDEHGIFPFSPVRVKNEIRAYISGISRRVSVSVDSSIGLAFSEDNGKTFTRYGDGPVLSSSLNEPYLITDGFARQYDGVFHIWYIFGTDWKVYQNGENPERTYKIGHATSKDGIEWVRSNRKVVKSRLEREAQALPCVIKRNGMYHMMFCFRSSFDFRSNQNNSYRLGYASGNDLYNWERNDAFAFSAIEPWCSEMICYPNMFECDGELCLLYNGNHFGRYGFGLAKLRED
jgi:hypothetical protein